MRSIPALPVLRRRALMALGGALLAGGAVAAASSASTVEVAVDGEIHDVRAYGGTVGDVLDRIDVTVGPADEVSLDRQTPVDDDLRVDIARAVTVDVEVHGAVARRVTAPVTSVAGVLEAADMDDLRDTGAEVVPGWDAPVEDGDTIEVSLPLDVTVAVDGDELELSTLASSVEEVLDESGVELGPDDVVLPAETGALLGPTTITVQRVEISEETVEVELPHDEVRRETDDLDRGDTRVDQEGRDGLRIDIFSVTSVDGEETERELVEEELVTEPRDRVVSVGTKPPPAPTAPSVPSTASSSGSSGGGVWDRLARCESGGNWATNTGNGYYGGLQFNPQTWRSVGGSGLPHQASKAEQIRRGQILQQRAGWGQWPACSRKLGLR